jgi:hypothetical protein
MDFVWKFEFFKTRKNSYIRPLWITDSEYEVIWILFKSLKFFKTHKTSYTGPLRITNLEYEGHDEEILSSDQFLP